MTISWNKPYRKFVVVIEQSDTDTKKVGCELTAQPISDCFIHESVIGLMKDSGIYSTIESLMIDKKRIWIYR